MPDKRSKQVVYRLPNQEQVDVHRDIVYKTTENGDLHLDVYYPAGYNHDTPLPAVLFIHGDAPAAFLKNIKDGGQYISWGQLVAASGMIAVTSNHRSTEQLTQLDEVASDIEDLYTYVRDHSSELGIDAGNLGVCVFSAGGTTGLSSVMRGGTPSNVKCIGAIYTYMDMQCFSEHLPHLSAETIRNYSPLYHLEQHAEKIAPLLIARAGLDRFDLNSTIDEFVAKALSKNINIEVLNHQAGQHAFDILDDNPRSHEIIARTLEFFKHHLKA